MKSLKISLCHSRVYTGQFKGKRWDVTSEHAYIKGTIRIAKTNYRFLRKKKKKIIYTCIIVHMYLKFMRLCYPRASFFVKTFSSNWTSIVPLSIKETDNYGLPVLFHNDFIPSYDSSHKLSSLYGKIDGQIIAYMFINKRISTFLKWLLSYPRDILIPLPERLCNMFRTYIHTYKHHTYI